MIAIHDDGSSGPVFDGRRYSNKGHETTRGKFWFQVKACRHGFAVVRCRVARTGKVVEEQTAWFTHETDAEALARDLQAYKPIAGATCSSDTADAYYFLPWGRNPVPTTTQCRARAASLKKTADRLRALASYAGKKPKAKSSAGKQNVGCETKREINERRSA